MTAATTAPIWSATTGRDDGPHIVLIHGSLDRSAGMSRLARRLHDRYRVTRYDRRGYGQSTPHPGPFDMEHQVSDLIDVIETSGARLRPRVVVGHSYGGNVALSLAVRNPELVDAVVTYETPLPWRPWWPSTSAGSDATAMHAQPEEAAEQFMRRMIGDDRWEQLPSTTRTSRRAEGPALVGELSDLRVTAPWHPDHVRVPVLALRGADAREHHRLSTAAIAAEIRDATFAEIGGAGHGGPHTHPDRIAKEIEAFIDRST